MLRTVLTGEALEEEDYNPEEEMDCLSRDSRDNVSRDSRDNVSRDSRDNVSRDSDPLSLLNIEALIAEQLQND